MKLRIVRDLLVLVITISTMIEGGLRTIDPLKWWVMTDDYYRLKLAQVPHNGYFLYKPGFYDLTRYDVTIQNSGLRAVPDSGNGCHIVALGDSFTFGWGVNDEEGWVNLAARDTGYRWTNAGLPGLSSANIARMIADYPADAYVYFNYDNDAHLPTNGIPPAEPIWAYQVYWKRLFQSGYTYQTDLTLYQESLESIQRDNLIMLMLDSHPHLELTHQYGGIGVSSQYERIGQEDIHPSNLGNIQLWETFKPLVIPFLEHRCESQ